MANRVQLGDLGSSVFGLRVSKPSVNVLTATDKQLLFDSTKARTGQIYAGASRLDFAEDTEDLDVDIRGNTNALTFTVNHSGKKIIIDGTTVTLSTTNSVGGTTHTSVNNMVTDINAANITGITASRRTISNSDHRLRIQKTAANGALVISYPASNSLELVVGINSGTYSPNILSTSGVNYLTGTGSAKTGLGYVPLIILTEDTTGVVQDDDEDENFEFEELSDLSLWEATATHMFPISAVSNPPSQVSNNNQGTFDAGGPIGRGRSYTVLEDLNEPSCTNCSFFVLRIPCGFGFMNGTYFG